jgi:hypothetical protein
VEEYVVTLTGSRAAPTATGHTLINTLPFIMRPVDDPEYAHFEDIIGPAMTLLRNITLQSFGSDYDTGDGACVTCDMTWTDTSPRGYT